MASAQQGQANTGFTLQIRRTFAVPRERVFAAWAEREQLEKWMCRDVSAHVITHHVQDIRTGGGYLMKIHDPAKGETYRGKGDYLEVKPPEKIVFTWSWEKTEPHGSRTEMHPGSPETQVTVEFFACGNSTEVVLTHGVFSSTKLRDEHDDGWNGCFDVLARVL
ncbi:MAG TPA: SRPBCC domain-containing protein [Candidatus Acidoferrum sp.]